MSVVTGGDGEEYLYTSWDNSNFDAVQVATGYITEIKYSICKDMRMGISAVSLTEQYNQIIAWNVLERDICIYIYV